MKSIILIAEDESALSNVLNNKLERHGFQVEIAHDGMEAVEKIKSLKPNLVLLDLIMPKKDGFEVLEEIKNDSEVDLEVVKIVVFSNLNQEEDRKRAIDLGVCDFLVKSDIGINDVVAKINGYLNINQ